MDHSQAPLLDALTDYRAARRYRFTLPGHRQVRPNGVRPPAEAVVTRLED
jgi:arginine decarboxylase